jgi:hypothetical protein
MQRAIPKLMVRLLKDITNMVMFAMFVMSAVLIYALIELKDYLEKDE